MAYKEIIGKRSKIIAWKREARGYNLYYFLLVFSVFRNSLENFPPLHKMKKNKKFLCFLFFIYKSKKIFLLGLIVKFENKPKTLASPWKNYTKNIPYSWEGWECLEPGRNWLIRATKQFTKLLLLVCLGLTP